MIERVAFTHYSGAHNFQVTPEFLFRFGLAICLAAERMPVILCGDETTKEIFVDDLKLPISEFRPICVPDSLSFMPMIAKIYGYRATLDAPTMHLDNDVFLYRKPRKDILDSPCAVQCVNTLHPDLDRIMDRLRSERPDLNIPNTGIGCCAGLAGFNDIDTERQMLDVSIALAEDQSLHDYFRSVTPGWNITSAIEEDMITAFFPQPAVFLDNAAKVRTNESWIRAGITHLNGGMKNEPERTRAAERRFAALYPDRFRLAWFAFWDKYSLLAE